MTDNSDHAETPPGYIDALDHAEPFPEEAEPVHLSRIGIDLDCTPIDTIMAQPLGAHLDTAWAMANPD